MVCLKSQIKSSIHELQKGVPMQARLFVSQGGIIFWQVYGYKLQSLNRCIFPPRGRLEFTPAAPDLAVKLSHLGGSNYSVMLMHNSVQFNYLHQCMSNVIRVAATGGCLEHLLGPGRLMACRCTSGAEATSSGVSLVGTVD